MRHLIIASVLCLTACNTPRPRIVKPPVELQTCAAEPAAPNLPERDGTDETQIRRDTMVLEYVLNLRSAYGDCLAKVAGIKAWSDGLD